MHVYLYAFDAVVEILDVSFYFGVAGELISFEVGVVRGVDEVVSDGQVSVDLRNGSEVVVPLAGEVGAEVIEAELSFYPLHDSLYVAAQLFLFLDKK